MLRAIPFQDEIKGFIDLIKRYSGNGTYFVRKMCAQALLPLLQFSEFVPQIVSCFDSLKA